MKKLIIGLSVGLLACLVCFLYLISARENHGYIINESVFAGYQGKVILEDALKQVQAKHKTSLDSMVAVMGTDAQSIMEIENAGRSFAEQEQLLSQKYTEDIWKEINQQVKGFGEENDYDFIYGAVGNGSLMYGSQSKDLTAEVINYINDKYEGNK